MAEFDVNFGFTLVVGLAAIIVPVTTMAMLKLGGVGLKETKV